jgi:Flp pilus assembly protein TadD
VLLSGGKKTNLLICLALALVTLGLYWQMHGFDFINYDDPQYVRNNPMVTGGLTLKGIGWAFTHFYAANWHPLTWISLMLDCQLFGVNAGATHIVNGLIHTANSILLFLLVLRLTGAPWRSAIIAAVFAWHPLHVQSVAWISERKDVLSTFFGLLSLLAYVRYAHKIKAAAPEAKTSFIWALVWFAMSLMSKPMLITLPFVMLLLDFWPLQRVENAGLRTFFSRPFVQLVKEKWPWFALMVMLAVITLRAQSTATATSEMFPVKWRVFNAIDSYFWYIEKTFWPTKLAFFYPLVYAIPVKTFVISSVSLLLITVAAFATIKRWPFFFYGWAWFLGTLVPVIGLVQVGDQSTADRYNYVPMIGLLIAFFTAAQWLLAGSRPRMLVAGIASATLLVTLATATFRQIGYWKNTFTLSSRALEVTYDNVTALHSLGVYFYEKGRLDDAEKMYRLALYINPNAADVHENLGVLLENRGDTNGALSEFQQAVRLNPKDPDFQNALAERFVRRGKYEDAIPCFLEAAKLDPIKAHYQNELAAALAAVGKRSEALPYYDRAVQLQPNNAQFQNNFATALLRLGDLKAAEEHYRVAIKADPKFAEAYSNLGTLLFARQQFADAANIYAEAVRLSPTNAGIHFNAGVAFLRARRVAEAKTQFAEASRLRPDWTDPLVAEAWALSTSSDNQIRNGPEAVKLAEKAAELTGHQQPAILNTLAAAYAEAGRFDDALTTANQALQLARQSNRTNLFPRIERAITLYQSRTPYRENTAEE